MQVFADIASLQAFLEPYWANNKTIGLVPTMGALHQGHMALIRQSGQENELTVCTIFVNPTQFNNANDLKNYPRTPEADLAILESSNCGVVFMPTPEVLYPAPTKTTFNFGFLEEVMEGPKRPGHFSGVATVVSKFFHVVRPTTAYFGQKDWQQCCVINQLVQDLNFPLQLAFVPTQRNSNGLALSSRNTLLSDNGLAIASSLYKSLQAVAKELLDGHSVKNARNKGLAILNEQPQIELEYLEVADSLSLKPLEDEHKVQDAVICIAAWLEGVRLIDNLLVKNFHN